MKRSLALGAAAVLAVALAIDASPSRAEPSPAVYASVSCAAASKPGRIRCRAVLELPLDEAGKRTLSWGELSITAAGEGVTPLRGRLGPLDAETRDDARITWTFSVAAAHVGERKLEVTLRGTLENKAGGAPQLFQRALTTNVVVTAAP